MLVMASRFYIHVLYKYKIHFVIPSPSDFINYSIQLMRCMKCSNLEQNPNARWLLQQCNALIHTYKMLFYICNENIASDNPPPRPNFKISFGPPPSPYKQKSGSYQVNVHSVHVIKNTPYPFSGNTLEDLHSIATEWADYVQ